MFARKFKENYKSTWQSVPAQTHGFRNGFVYVMVAGSSLERKYECMCCCV